MKFIFLLAGLTVAVVGASAGETPRPNIVYLISDDHAWTDYGFMGHPQIETPNLDRLAARSAWFPRGYVPTALCRPALATLATGLYAHQHKISGNGPAPLPIPEGKRRKDSAENQQLKEKLIAHIDQVPTLGKLLGQRGYLSFQSGKWWEGSYQRGGFTHGMTRGFPQPGGRHGDAGLKIGREGMAPVFDFIDHAVAQKKPFLLWFAPMMPHSPHTPPDRLLAKYQAKGIASDHVARYFAMVEWFDEACGQLLDRLEAKGLTRDTLVVYLADNGWIQKEDGEGFAPRSKQTANEGGIRQPILFSWPGVIRAGRRGQELCSSIDIFPTVLAAAGAEIPQNVPGYDLLPILRAGTPTPRDILYGEAFAHDIANIERPEDSLLYRWAIQGKWKLLLTYDGNVGERGAEVHTREEKRPQLFDLLADPHENLNLAANHPDIVARLAGRLDQWWHVSERKVMSQWPK
jgi:arylsulfatase A-like enzyme